MKMISCIKKGSITMNMRISLKITTAVVALCLSPQVLSAQTNNQPEDDEAASEKTPITVIGSRRAEARSATDSPVPVDVLKADDIKAQGSTDIIEALSTIVPSLTASREPISDAATLVRPVNLRALPSDHTLVLVNGKRRHRGAVVGEFVSGINRGAQGVDITPLFGASLKQVDVLRDGAAAQYGSDAIAGVINYQLLDNPEARDLSVQYSKSYIGDGVTIEASGAIGAHIGDGGFFTFAFEVKDQDATSRGVQDGEGTTGGATGLAAAGFPVANPVVVWGQPNVKDDYKFTVNSALPVGDSELYLFGNYSTRKVDGSFFYRNPTSRQGVFANGANALFADTTGAGGCPVGPLPSTSFAAAQAFVNRAPANCFSFFSRFPGGFTPRFGGTVNDFSGTAGFRGKFDSGFTYDFSAGIGRNALDYRITNTVNASLGPDSPTSFDLGAQIQKEIVANADFVYPVNIGLASDLNIAFGVQYHDDSFEIAQGEVDSYRVGRFITQDFSAGANGFQGFSPDVAGLFTRNSIGAYVDLEADITDAFVLSGAARYEKFSDFGDTFNGKISGLYKLSDNIAIRGSASTGFRAPTLGQSNLQRSATSFSGGQLVESLVVSSTNPIALRFGGGQIKPEKAKNFSLGATGTLGKLTLTVDYFNIKVTDRIAQTTANLSAADRAALVAGGQPEAATISQAQFFVNDFDTRTQGVDVVANFPFSSSAGDTNLTLAVGYNDTKVINGGATVNRVNGRIQEIEDSVPALRSTFTVAHNVGIFNGLVRVNYYSKTFENLFNDNTLPLTTPSLFIVDAEIGAKFADHFKISVGAKNLFDTYPEEFTLSDGSTGRTPGFLGAIYPLNHPAGFNGGSYYIRLSTAF
jgi:iron complex outermembrane recepter protein